MSATRRNILFIHVDQLKSSAVGAYGADRRLVRTPGMDALAARGTLFERSYSTNPICVPARTVWYTGLPSHETGVVTNGSAYALRKPTLGPIVGGAGYDPLYIGKWHVPTTVGKEFTVLPGGHSKGEIGDAGVARAVENFLAHRPGGGKPFFLNVGLLNPHDICYTSWKPAGPLKTGIPAGRDGAYPELPPLPPNFSGERSDGWTEAQWLAYIYTYYRYTEMVDAEIGRIAEALWRSPHGRDTLLIFSSDHGQGNGEHGHHTKNTPYEHSARVPLILCGPGIPAGRRVSGLVSGLDIAPTVCAAAGTGAPPGARGLDLVAAAADPAVIPADRVIAGCTSLLKYRWLVGQRHKFVQMRGRQAELYDLEADPWEREDLAKKDRKLAAELDARLAEIESGYAWDPNAIAARDGELKSRDDDE